jgi:simple sugar transport system ATP-binding protein
MLQLRDLSKNFGPFAALSSVNFSVGAGEVVGLLGENGAGKSTLLNIVGGNLQPTSGGLRWNDETVHFASPRAATQCGIGVVHQHFMLVPSFSVAENMALQAPQSGAIFNATQWKERVESWAEQLGWQVDANACVESLSVGERQRVEIIKALFAASSSNETHEASTHARLLLLDEPTANLTPGEVTELFDVVRRLRAQGCGVVFVSHKLNEVMELCDRVVVLRHGKVVGERRTADTNTDELASLMVGRQLEAASTRAPHEVNQTSPVRLHIEQLSSGLLQNFSLDVHSGEIVGLAGVDGNGQRELAELLGGLRVPQSGSFRVMDESSAVSRLAVIPPDRQETGLILNFNLYENMVLQPDLRARCKRLLNFDWNTARARTRELMQQYDVRSPATRERALAAQLSGGNQQKLVIARALEPLPSVLVAAEPTRGLDVGAAHFVHEQLRRAAANGCAVLLISTDLDEVLQLSDRIGVLYCGRLLPGSELLPATSTREMIGALMGGVVEESLR